MKTLQGVRAFACVNVVGPRVHLSCAALRVIDLSMKTSSSDASNRIAGTQQARTTQSHVAMTTQGENQPGCGGMVTHVA